MASGKYLTEETKRRIHKAFVDGVTNVAVCERFGLTRQHVAKLRKEFNEVGHLRCIYHETCVDEICSHKFEHLHNGGCDNGCQFADYQYTCKPVKVVKKGIAKAKK